MSWLFSLALVEEYLGANCSDGEQSVQSNGNHTQQAYCSPDKMTEYSRLSPSGMTFKPLTENLGKELLTLYLEGFHARTLPPMEKVTASTDQEVACGKKWPELLAKLDHNTSLWRTPQCSLEEDSAQSLEIWPRWGSMQNGVSYQQPKLERITSAVGSGLWPTPTTPTGGGTLEALGLTKMLSKTELTYHLQSTRTFTSG